MLRLIVFGVGIAGAIVLGVTGHIGTGVFLAAVTVLWTAPSSWKVSEDQGRRRSFLVPTAVLGALFSAACGAVAALILVGVITGSATTFVGLIVAGGGGVGMVVRALAMLRADEDVSRPSDGST